MRDQIQLSRRDCQTLTVKQLVRGKLDLPAFQFLSMAIPCHKSPQICRLSCDSLQGLPLLLKGLQQRGNAN